MNDNKATRFKGRWLSRAARVLIILTAIWFAADFGYFCFVSWRYRVWERGKLRDAQGVLHECAEFSLGQGDDAILLIHGINGSPHNWQKMAPRFAASGFHVHALRLPGFAEPLQGYGSYSIKDWLSKVDVEVQRLRSQHRRVFVVAQSLGGAITIRYVLDNPSAVNGVALLSPAVEVSDRRSPLFPTRFWHSFCTGLIFTNFVTSSFDNDAHDPAARDSSHESCFTPRRVIDQTFALVDYNRGRGSEIKLPLIMFLTHNDKVVDWQAAETFFQQTSSAPKILKFNDDAGHPLSLDYGWEQVTDETLDFFKGLK